jgi:TonB-linked SusC/RagA family outer membrane protein
MYNFYSKKRVQPPGRIANILLIMKITTLLLVIAILQVSASSFAQKVTLTVKNAPLVTVFDQIRKQTGYDFLFSSSILKDANSVNINVKNVELNEVLKKIFESQPLEFSIENKSVVISSKEESLMDKIKDILAIPIDVHGQVTDSAGTPLIGASIRVKNGKMLAVTNATGEFSIKNIEIGTTLVISYISYLPRELTISRENADKISIVLQAITGKLNEITVSTGYQTIPKERATGSYGVITSKDIEKRMAPDLLERIEGDVPGLLVTVGQPDRSLIPNRDQFTIRGTSTINANKTPLIVLNGFPTELDLVNINPDDVESITVLKDAAAASIWGIRAANGVLVIQTKVGKFNSPTQVNYSSIFTFSASPRLNYLPVLQSADYLSFEKELVNKGILPLASSPLVLFPPPTSAGTQLAIDLKAGRITQAQYDQQAQQLSQNNVFDQYSKYILRNAFSQQHNISISGGSENSRSYLSGSYSNELANAVNNSGQRLTVNFNNETRITNKLTVTNNIEVTILQDINNGIGLAGLEPGSNTLLPYEQIVNSSGASNNFYYRAKKSSLDSLQAKGFLPWTYNYLDELSNADNTEKSLTYRLTSGINYKILPILSADVKYMMEKGYDKTRNYYNPNTYYARNLVNSYTTIDTHVNGVPKGGVLNQSETDQDNYNLRGQLNLNPNFGPKNRLDAIIGAEIRQTVATSFANTAYGYDDRLQTSSGPSYTTNYKTVNSTTSRVPYAQTYANLTNKYASFFGNFTYTYDGKYSLSGSARKDNSNLFGSNADIKNNPLFSFGGLWRIAEESFLKEKTWISTLNIRATYGFNGNINNNASPFLIIAPSSTTNAINGSPFASIANAANPLLSAERVKTINFGTDFSFFNNRLGGSVDAYWRKSLDLLGQVPIDPTYGFTSLYANQLQMTSRGIDLELHGTVIRSEQFSWTPSLNLSYNTNKVTQAYFQQQTTTYYTNPSNPIQGQSLGSVYVYRFAGLNNQGDAMIYNGSNQKIFADDKSFSTTDLGALTNKGVTIPPYFGSFANTITYKRFEIYALFTFKAGDVFTRPGPNQYFSLPYTRVLNSSWANRWEKPGDELTTNIPSIDANHEGLTNYLASDLFIDNASYVRLRDLTLTYHIPIKDWNWKFMRTLDVSITGRNLALWTANKDGIDPDYIPTSATVTLPPSKTFIFSIRAGF